MTITYIDYGDIWVCTDCYFAHHYGYHEVEPGLFTIGPDFGRENETHQEPLALIAGDLEASDNTCSNHEYDDVNTCQYCGHSGYEDGLADFSWRRCDGCGSTLGGSRSRLHLSKREEA